MKPILLLEDDAALSEGLSWALTHNGFPLEAGRTAAEARDRLTGLPRYSLLILDITLPDGSGFEICREVRERDTRIPILFLTASDEEVSVIRGLDSGGDDYITKPFRMGELCSRIRALLRRAGNQADPNQIVSGDLTLNLSDGRVFRGGSPLQLTATEFRLLSFLVRHATQTLSRNQILEQLWDTGGDFVDSNTLSVYVRRLREKVETDPNHPQHLLTVRGYGYSWKEAPQ